MTHFLFRRFCGALAIVLIAGAASTTGLQAQEYEIAECSNGRDVNGGDSYVGDISYVDAGLVGPGGANLRRGFGQPDLFYNYFTQGYRNSANAQMYLSPLPIPPNVGHTYYTYQPFYPHHMLYAHKDRYHRYYDNGRGMNRTRAVYSYPPVKTALSNFYWNYFRLAR